LLNIAFHPKYQLPLPDKHRFPMEKYDLLPKQLMYDGTCIQEDFFVPKPIDLSIIERVHEPEYVKKLRTLTLNKSEARKIGFPLSKELVEREIIIAGGTIQGSMKAFETGVAMNIAGGTHHAFKGHGEAFCLLNDQAIAAQYLLDKKLVDRILIVDLDVHQGNGTAEIFQSNPNVFTFSMHGQKNYPFHKEQSDLDIALEDDCNDGDFLRILKKVLPGLIAKTRPDFIFYLCGVDVLKTDKLGRLGLTVAGCKQRDVFVLELCKKNNIPVQCSMGGGYSKEIKVIVDAHANTFRAAKHIFD
jgi:acetoin utilization deacetylase AcuC-like enzyme|tara:strand:+ start:1224 stop:2126 length:903 start_codon:yes stop_codon:yes gene_type:complete